ncbi:MAG: YraN family protein [Candidatus Sericytochromatia bacterium]|nr:YraN family protein [Candidatus Sericytochromatia bacterium]
MHRNIALGRAGEAVATAWYRARGAEIVARNVRLPRGEIDLIVRESDTMCFVEVKCRRHEPAEGFVCPRKARRLRLLARWYLEKRHWHGDIRFDVLGIEWPMGREPRIVHIPEAF